MFDTVCKFLVENFSADFATWLLGDAITLSELSPSELSLEPIRADALILLQSAETILHLEFQSRPDPEMAFRMADYRLRVYRRFPKRTMRQVVIYLQSTQSQLVYQTSFEIPGTHHEFEVIRLWEESPDSFLARPGLMPFAVLAQTPDRPQLLRQVAAHISQLSDPRVQSNVAASTAILAGLLLEKGLIQQVLRKELMQDSVIYQDIWEEGRQEGRQEGRREGRRQEGVTLVRRLLIRRIGTLPEAIHDQIVMLSLAQLEALSDELLEFSALVDLETWLNCQQEALDQGLQRLIEQWGELSPEIRAEVQALSIPQLELLKVALPEFLSLGDLMTWLQAQAIENDQLGGNPRGNMQG